MKNKIIVFLFIVLCCVSHGDAETVVYLDRFEGESGEVLKGQIPDVSLEKGVQWQSGQSGAPWMADGTITLRNQSCNAFLPFTPQRGRIYSLSFDVCPKGPLGAGFLSIGFSGTNTFDTAFVAKDAMVSPWMYINHDWIVNPRSRLAGQTDRGKKITRTYRTYLGPGNVGAIPPKEAYGEWVSAEIALDTREDVWKVRWYVNGECIRTLEYEKNPVIHYVGIGRFRQVSGAIDNFKLSVIPE